MECPPTIKNYLYLRASEKIAYKNLSVYCIFPFESAGFFQSIEFSVQRTWKEASLHLKLGWFCHTSFFQRNMFDKLVLGCIWLCAPYFERVLHGEIREKFRCEHCSFKVWVHWCCGLWKNIVDHTENSVYPCICLHLQKLFAKMQYFQSTPQAKLNTLKNSTF